MNDDSGVDPRSNDGCHCLVDRELEAGSGGDLGQLCYCSSVGEALRETAVVVKSHIHLQARERERGIRYCSGVCKLMKKCYIHSFQPREVYYAQWETVE